MTGRLRLIVPTALLAMLLTSAANAAGTRVIVRVSAGLTQVRSLCLSLGCTVNYPLGDPDGQVFLITTSSSDVATFLSTLHLQLGVLDAELDLRGQIQTERVVPAALFDRTAVSYFGAPAWNGYINQPASAIIGLPATRDRWMATGTGTVAVIDTGVDPSHSLLVPVLLSGYDFTRDRSGADERADLPQSAAVLVDDEKPGWVNESTVAVVDQSTVGLVDTAQYSAFGHGTMVAGIIHLVAPKASILPMKAFGPDGAGYMSDVLRAIYRSVNANARVLNMSFSFTEPSNELRSALAYANRNHVICVASAGNNGQAIAVYPAAYRELVMGVASTTNSDIRSDFSNYGQPQVWMASPGEAVITTYPWNTYAAAWGTSFSSPMVAGSAALLLEVSDATGHEEAAWALGHAKFMTSDLGYGRLDVYQAVSAWRQALGLP
jgi:subtilisin family serine protease